MTSRDGYNRNRPMKGSTQNPGTPERQNSNWELDADELDRYMSGQPAREPRFDPYGRSQSDGRTERQPAQTPQARVPRIEQPRQQPQQQQPQYQDYPTDTDTGWAEDEYGYEDDARYDDFQPEPAPAREQRTQRQHRQAPRARQPEPVNGDDLYDDPYVLDDEESPQRPARRPQRPNRERPARQAPSFTMPAAIADAPIVQDRTALAMAGAAFLSLLVMIIIVATGKDGLSDVIFTHVNANGEPANLQSADAIWNLPLIAGMVTLISAVSAWFLARWGQFLPRFLLGGSIGVQFVVWIAVIAYLF